MVVVVNCYLCEQPVPLTKAVLVEASEEADEGYFAHGTCVLWFNGEDV